MMMQNSQMRIVDAKKTTYKMCVFNRNSVKDESEVEIIQRMYLNDYFKNCLPINQLTGFTKNLNRNKNS